VKAAKSEVISIRPVPAGRHFNVKSNTIVCRMRSPRAPVKIFSAIPVAVGLALSQAAVAAPPDHRDPALAPWFESLKQPGSGAPCCSIADCRTAEFRHDRDGYEVLIDGRWKMSVPFWARVPPNRIIEGSENPTGRGVVCFAPEAGILCFVPPPES